MTCMSSSIKGLTDLHDMALLSISFEIGLNPIIRGLSENTPRIWYASLFETPRGIQPLRANLKISNGICNRHSSPSLRREAATCGSSFLEAAMTSGRPAYRTQNIHGPSQFFFILPPIRRGLGGHACKDLQVKSHRGRRLLTFSVRVVKCWKMLPPTIVKTPQIFPH